MTAQRKTLFGGLPFVAALSLLVLPLLCAGQAGAVYFLDGAVGNSPLTYDNPNDGQCVVGIRMNAGVAELLVDKNITNFKDCAAYTTNLTGMTTQTQCAPAASGSTLGVGTDGWRHAWSSVCKTGATGISRVDLDNTVPMCTSKGGTVGSVCVAYGWLYRGVDPVTGAAPPFTGSPAATPFNTSNYAVWHGVDSTRDPNTACTGAGAPAACCTGVGTGTCPPGNGFCYTAMDFTAVVSPAYTRPLSTSWPDPGNADACPMFHPDNATGRARTGTTWSDYVWNWKSSPEIGAVPPTTGTICRNAYGVKGKLVTAVTSSVAGNAYTVGPTVDLQGFTDQAQCIANGFSWEPLVRTIGFVDATVRGVLSATPCGTAAACYAAVDITTPGNAGGGKFVSRQCLKCHSDQSRGLLELDKPGFIETPHKKAGDSSDPVIAAVGNTWGLKGIQCSICHAASNPQKTDLINKNDAGAFIQTSAHENATAGAGVTQVCYHCHSDATLGSSSNTTPAAVIPVSAGDFAENAQHLAPIVNQFLNSPHGEYSGSNDGGQLRDKTKYASTFIGYNCKTAGTAPATQSAQDAPGGTVAWTAANCAAANYVWGTPAGSTTAGCYPTQTTCLAAGGTWNTTFDATVYPYGNLASPAGVCSGAGQGTSLSTRWRTGNSFCTAAGLPASCCTGSGTGTCTGSLFCTAAGDPASCCTGSGTGTCAGGTPEPIEFPDSTTNTNCTNPGDGSATSGAVGYWVPEGNKSSNSKGSCMTCHDVHWDFDSTIPGAEPFRRECTTCHVNSGTSASGAPQIDLATINHLKSAGTPLENWLTKPEEACEICHMAVESGTSSPMHLWRISTDPAYVTMGGSQANTAAEKKCAGGVKAGQACAINVDCPSSTCDTVYTNAVWVDIPHACGQCHGTDGITATDPGAPPRSTAQLALVAKGMHDGSGKAYAVTFSAARDATNTLKVNVDAQVTCDGVCPTLTYDWDWGDSTAHGSADPDNHTYASATPATKSITLTIYVSGKTAGSVTRSVTVANPDLPPTVGKTCTWNANTWTLQLVDSSTDDGADADMLPGDGVLRVMVDWGDGTTRSVGAGGGTFTHTYSKVGAYITAHTAIDSTLRSASDGCGPYSPAYFTISGTVKSNGGANLASATVIVKEVTASPWPYSKTVYTSGMGTFLVGSLKPGTYTVTAKKTGYTFPAAPSVTVPAAPVAITANP